MLLESFSINAVDGGYMIMYLGEDGYDYIKSPDGNNLFDEFGTALIVLAHYLLGVAVRGQED